MQATASGSSCLLAWRALKRPAPGAGHDDAPCARSFACLLGGARSGLAFSGVGSCRPTRPLTEEALLLGRYGQGQERVASLGRGVVSDDDLPARTLPDPLGNDFPEDSGSQLYGFSLSSINVRQFCARLVCGRRSVQDMKIEARHPEAPFKKERRRISLSP
jgi:hypothetical protein